MKPMLTGLLLAFVLGTAWSQDVAVRANALVPVGDSFDVFKPGAGLGAEMAWVLPDHAWRVTGALDTNSVGYAGRTFYMTLTRPGLRYDAFFGPTAFMSFGIDAGWAVATQRDLQIVKNQACAGAGASVSFYLGSHVNFRTELRYVEVFGVLHAITGSIGFEVAGS